MNLYGYEIQRDSDLMHYGVLGMKWGVRRYQNPDGSLKAAGKKHYYGGGSIGGSAHRALAKVYDINAKTYGRLGNKTLASINAAAKNQQLKKAEEADKKSVDKRINKFEKRFNKYENEVSDFNSETLNAREKHHLKLENKASKASSKLNDSSVGTKRHLKLEYKANKASFKLNDFNEGTKYVKAGQGRVNDVIAKYKEMKIAAIKDPSIKKTAEYRQIGKEWTSIMNAGLPASTLIYAMEEAGKK